MSTKHKTIEYRKRIARFGMLSILCVVLGFFFLMNAVTASAEDDGYNTGIRAVDASGASVFVEIYSSNMAADGRSVYARVSKNGQVEWQKFPALGDLFSHYTIPMNSTPLGKWVSVQSGPVSSTNDTMHSIWVPATSVDIQPYESGASGMQRYKVTIDGTEVKSISGADMTLSEMAIYFGVDDVNGTRWTGRESDFPFTMAQHAGTTSQTNPSNISTTTSNRQAAARNAITKYGTAALTPRDEAIIGNPNKYDIEWYAGYRAKQEEFISLMDIDLTKQILVLFGTEVASSEQVATNGGLLSLPGGVANYYEYRAPASIESDPASSVTQAKKVRDLAGTVKPFIKTMSTVLIGFSLFLVVLYAFIEFFRDIAKADATIEMWARLILSLLVSMTVIINYEVIISGLEGIGHYFISAVYKATGDGSSISMDSLSTWMREAFAIENPKLEFRFTSLLTLGVPTLIANLWAVLTGVAYRIAMGLIVLALQVPLIAGRIALYTIWIELILRKAFFPVAVARVAGEGLRSPGIMYMKRFLAVYIRIAMCIAVAFIGSLIINAFAGLLAGASSIMVGIINLCAVWAAFLLVAKLYTQTGRLADQIVGVH